MSAIVTGIARHNVVEAVFEADGNEEKAVQILYRKQLQPYIARVNKTCTPQDLEWLRNPNVPIEVKLQNKKVA